jgi:uncharacterized membrane protein YphA (DoxX/SURF4 family)
MISIWLDGMQVKPNRRNCRVLREKQRRSDSGARSSKRAMMNTRWAGLATVSSVFLRLALGISFLSAVADRFGLWGVYGEPNVAWGNYARFVAYTAKLNWFLPAATIPALAIIATAAETLFGILLVLGWKTRTIALLSGVLLTTFALTMTMALGVKAPLDLSVFSAAGGALFLATSANFPFSFDELVRQNKQAESSARADQANPQ